MNSHPEGRRYSRSALSRWLGLAAMALLCLPSAAEAQSGENPDRILKAMYDYIASQKNISMTFDTSVEVVTPNHQKLQFTSSGQVLLSRPDKIHATRTGGYADVELVFDGKTVSIAGKNMNVFAQRDAPGTIDQLVDRLRDDGMDLAGADLLLARGYEDMMSDVTDATHIGRGVVAGVECEHLAFRADDVDWQIWIEVGARPIPRKYVITSKAVAGEPQYTILVKDWKTDVQVPADAFAFKPAADMKKVDVSALQNIDEIPQGSTGGKTTGSGGNK